MRQFTVHAISVLLVALSLTGVPALSAAPNSRNQATIGTTQASGQNARIGVTYTLGKVNPINITLNKVEYTTEPVIFGNVDLWPKKDEKLMVLHYTLHNPNPRDFRLAWSTLGFDVVDKNDKNWRYVGDVAVEGTHEKANMSLKRAQKTNVYTAIVVPAQGEIPKLMIQSQDKLVLRYDLRGKVNRLPASIADPADASGATVLEKVSAQMGAYYPLCGLYGKIDSAEFTTAPVKGKAPKKGCRYMVVTGAAKNTMARSCRFVWSTFAPKATDADGGDLRLIGEPLFASRDDAINAEMEQNQELRFRYVFEVPENVKPTSFAFSQGGSHAYAYDLSQVK